MPVSRTDLRATAALTPTTTVALSSQLSGSGAEVAVVLKQAVGVELGVRRLALEWVGRSGEYIEQVRVLIVDRGAGPGTKLSGSAPMDDSFHAECHRPPAVPLQQLAPVATRVEVVTRTVAADSRTSTPRNQ